MSNTSNNSPPNSQPQGTIAAITEDPQSQRWAGTYTVALLLAAVAALVLAELSLRFAAWIGPAGRTGSTATGGVRHILCIGDAWTMGAPGGRRAVGLPYPAVLQKLLDDGRRQRAFQVTNLAKAGAHSRDILRILQRPLRRHRPLVVVAMMGAANFFDVMDLSKGPAGLTPLYSPRTGLAGRIKILQLLKIMLSPKDGTPPFPSRALMRHHINSNISATAGTRIGNIGRERVQGVPPLPRSRCTRPEQYSTIFKSLIHLASKGALRMEEALKPDPICDPLLVHAAELCLEKDNLVCAQHFARKVLAQMPGEPNASVILATALYYENTRWTDEAAALLDQVVRQHPTFIRARRLRCLALLHRKKTLCPLQTELHEVLKRCPDCRWTKNALHFIKRALDSPGMQVLESDLRALVSLTRRYDARLLLLSYPSSDRFLCGKQARTSILRVAQELDIPVLDLGKLLGPVTVGKASKSYDKEALPTTAAHQALAKEVLKVMQDREWISSK